MYICLHCGHEFEEIAAKNYDSSTGTWEEYCPNCGSEDFEEAEVCEMCGEAFAKGELKGHVCDKCRAKYSDPMNAYCYGADRKESVELNGFIKWMFTAEEIETILMKAAKEEAPAWLAKEAREYINDDEYDFGEWLTDKGEDK